MENNVNWSGEMVHGVICQVWGDLNLDPQNLIKYGCSSVPVIPEQGKVGVEAGESQKAMGWLAGLTYTVVNNRRLCLKQGRSTDSSGCPLYTSPCVPSLCRVLTH